MPIDPRIPLMGAPPAQLQSPVEVLSSLTQLQAVREQTEARRLAAEEARTKLARQRAVDEALQQAITVDPTSGRITIDKAKVMANLPHIGGATALALQDSLDDHEVKANALVKSKVEVETTQRQLLGSLANGVVVSGGDPALWRDALRKAKALGSLDDARYQELVALDDPAKILPLAQGYVAAAGGKPEALEKVTHLNEAGEEVTEFVRPKEGATYRTTPKNVNLQAKDVLLDGRPALATFNPGTGTYSVAGQDVTARVRPIPPQGPGPEALVAIIGPDGQPVLVPRSQAVGARPATGAGGVRGVTATDARTLADYNTSRDDLKLLSTAITTTGATGTRAAAGAALPNWVTDVTGWGTDAKKKQALIDRVKQVIGKTLEGGVLRKEDEAKYERILPTISDPPAIVTAKLQGLDTAIAHRATTHVEALADAGYDVSRFEARPARAPMGTPGAPSPPPAARKVGDIVTVKGQKVRITKLLPGGKYEAVPVP